MSFRAVCICGLLYFFFSWISRSVLYVREVDFVMKFANTVSKFLSFNFDFYQAEVFDVYVVILSIFCGFWILSYR